MCKLGTGEEGHDWEVRYINDTKGFGVVALRDFERGERILAERILDRKVVLSSLSPTEKLAVQELMPVAGTMLDRLHTNALSTDEGGGICLRLVRANHACVPNACHYDEYKGVKLLVARTAIKAGEEITISYLLWYNLQSDCDAVSLRAKLSKRGIHCLTSCKCYDQELATKLRQAQQLYSELKPKFTFVCGGKPVPQDKLVKLMYRVEELELSHVNVSAVCYAAHTEYMCRGEVSNAMRYVRKSLDMNMEVYGPKSESVEYDRGLVSEIESMCGSAM